MRVNGPRQYLTFDIPPERDIVFGGLRMGDAHDVLFEDRPFIQIGGHVMRCRPDQLDAAFVGLVVGRYLTTCNDT